MSPEVFAVRRQVSAYASGVAFREVLRQIGGAKNVGVLLAPDGTPDPDRITHVVSACWWRRVGKGKRARLG